jgi:hypothetical protein
MATLSLVVAGCGDSDEEKFRDAYDPVDEQLSDLGEEVQDALQAAEKKSDEELAQQFEGFADDLADIEADIERLDPPSDVEDDVTKLERAIDDVEGSLRDIAAAGRENDPAAARTATLELIQQGERLDELQQRVGSAASE